MKLLQSSVALLIAVILTSGCNSAAKKADTLNRGGKGPEIGQYGDNSGANPSQVGNAAENGITNQDDPNGPLSKRIIYFVYDSSEVQPEYLTVITSHANYLASNPVKSVVLEGHADERGSPEYNIALGELRAQSVAKLMKLQGVASNQIQIVSFGEEKPAVNGHDENAWQLNRRVEITYPER